MGGGGFRGGGLRMGGGARMGGGVMRGPGGGALRHGGGHHGGGHHGGGHGGRWGRGRGWGGGGWGWGGGWVDPGYAVYNTVVARDPCEECWDLPPYTRAYDRCVIENDCRTPLLHPALRGLGQTPTSAQDAVNRTTGMIAGTIAGGVIGLGVGVLALGGIAYYMFVGRHRRVRRNRRRSR
jgi:hypothetical protein